MDVIGYMIFCEVFACWRLASQEQRLLQKCAAKSTHVDMIRWHSRACHDSWYCENRCVVFGIPPKLWYSWLFDRHLAKNCRYLQECATISFQAPIGQTLLSPYACTKVCMCIISQGSQSPKEVSVGSCTYVVEQRTFLQSFQIQARPVTPLEKLGYSSTSTFDQKSRPADLERIYREMADYRWNVSRHWKP